MLTQQTLSVIWSSS